MAVMISVRFALLTLITSFRCKCLPWRRCLVKQYPERCTCKLTPRSWRRLSSSENRTGRSKQMAHLRLVFVAVCVHESLTGGWKMTSVSGFFVLSLECERSWILMLLGSSKAWRSACSRSTVLLSAPANQNCSTWWRRRLIATCEQQVVLIRGRFVAGGDLSSPRNYVPVKYLLSGSQTCWDCLPLSPRSYLYRPLSQFFFFFCVDSQPALFQPPPRERIKIFFFIFLLCFDMMPSQFTSRNTILPFVCCLHIFNHLIPSRQEREEVPFSGTGCHFLVKKNSWCDHRLTRARHGHLSRSHWQQWVTVVLK